MKKSIKNLWLSALRGGRYKQGREMLKTPQGEYCCLGVLTNLYLKKKKKSWKMVLKNYCNEDIACISQATLPKEVKRWAGLKDHDPIVTINEGAVHCSNLNDDLRMTFKQIADVIEKQL